jgi:hypothetical protein
MPRGFLPRPVIDAEKSARLSHFLTEMSTKMVPAVLVNRNSAG